MCYNIKKDKKLIKKFPVLIFPLLLLVFLIGCSEENTTQPDPTLPSAVPTSRLSDIQQKVFSQSCAFTNCHGQTSNQANLLLTDGNSFSNLVNVQSLLFPQFTRVIPDSSSKSLLIKILKGEVSPRMPLNSDPLDQAVIDSIATWIDNGALNN
jgi:hypothetical protein